MSTLLTLTMREWKAFWYSPIAYVVGALFLLLQGVVFWTLLLVLNDPRVDPTWTMSQFFFGGTLFYWLAVFMLAPVLTMRTLSEERRTGTIEVLLTAPVTDGQVAGAKFLGAWATYAALWALTIPYFLVLRHFTALDWGPIATGYLGTWLLGGVFIAVGVFASSLTRNQIIAAVLSSVLILLLFFIGLLDMFVTDPEMSKLVRYLSLMNHFRDFAKGILDTRPIAFYASLIVIALFLTARAIGNPKRRT